MSIMNLAQTLTVVDYVIGWVPNHEATMWQNLAGCLDCVSYALGSKGPLLHSARTHGIGNIVNPPALATHKWIQVGRWQSL